MQHFKRISHVIGWVVSLWLCLMPMAIASIHTYPEGNDQIMIRSLQTLRDRTDQAWQLVLFKRIKDTQTESIHLRIVGFPGQAEFLRTKPLKIETSTYAAIAENVLPNPSPFPNNTGEYDIQDFVQHLTSDSPLHLVLPISEQEIDLMVPPFVVKEWRRLLNTDK
jgi:Protein of unknown function (DUF3122)